MRVFSLAVALAGFGLLVPAAAGAQTLHMLPQLEEEPFLGFRVLVPNFSGFIDQTSSATFDLYGGVPIARRLNLVASVPFTTGTWTTELGEQEASGLGAVSVGLEAGTGNRRGHTSLAFTVHLPTAPRADDLEGLLVRLMGVGADLYGLPSYLGRTLSLSGNYAYHRVGEGGLRFGVEAGPVLAFPIDPGPFEPDDSEVLVRYGLAWGGEVGRLTILSEFLGLVFLTDDPGYRESLIGDDRFANLVVLGVRAQSHPVRPAIFYQFPLDADLDGFTDGALGLGVELLLGSEGGR